MKFSTLMQLLFFFGFSLVIGGLIYDYLTVEVTSDNLTNSVSIGHSAPITDDTLESDDDEDELSDEEEAKLISLKTWRIERIHSSCFHDDNGDLTWALLMIIMHDDDSYELTVTDWHDESTSYFLLKEGQEIRFEFSEQNLVNDYTDHEFITDYLKPILVAGKQDQ